MSAALLRRPSSSMKASEVVPEADHDCTGTVKTGAWTASAGRSAAGGAAPAPHWCSTYTLELERWRTTLYVLWSAQVGLRGSVWLGSMATHHEAQREVRMAGSGGG